MKSQRLNQVMILIGLLSLSTYFTSCNSFLTVEEEELTTFVASYDPNEEAVLGDGILTAKITLNDEGLSFSKMTDYYANTSYIKDYIAVGKNSFALGLHDVFDTGFNEWTNNGLHYNVTTETGQILPLLAPDYDTRYNYIKSNSLSISDDGMVSYLSATNDKSYHDQYRAQLLRFDPSTGDYKVAGSPTNFALTQPEKGSDTDAGQFGTTGISNNGDYTFGYIEAYGIEGGGIHWDYEFIFKYDWDAEKFTRLGSSDHYDSRFIGITSDDKFLLYSNDGLHVQNLLTDVVYDINNFTTTPTHTSDWNNQGYVRETSSGINYYNIIDDTVTEIIDGVYGVNNAQFNEDGTQVYFTYINDGIKYLCRTLDLNENTTFDEIGEISPAFFDLFLLR